MQVPILDWLGSLSKIVLMHVEPEDACQSTNIVNKWCAVVARAGKPGSALLNRRTRDTPELFFWVLYCLNHGTGLLVPFEPILFCPKQNALFCRCDQKVSNPWKLESKLGARRTVWMRRRQFWGLLYLFYWLLTYSESFFADYFNILSLWLPTFKKKFQLASTFSLVLPKIQHKDIHWSRRREQQRVSLKLGLQLSGTFSWVLRDSSDAHSGHYDLLSD